MEGFQDFLMCTGLRFMTPVTSEIKLKKKKDSSHRSSHWAHFN